MLTSSMLFARLMSRARLRHLLLIVRIAELESLQKAAESIGLSQPGATHALAELESMLEAPLFERHARGMRPTPVGHDILPLVRHTLRTMQSFAETVSNAGIGASGTVRIGAIGAAMSGVLPDLMPPFSTAHPDIVVDVLALAADDLMQALESGDVDVLFCREPAQLPESARFAPLKDDRYAVVCGPAHPLARRRTVTLQHLAGQTWLQGPPTGLATREFERLCAALGFVPQACWVSGRAVLLALAMLQQRELLAFMPLNTAKQLLDNRLLVELAVPQTFKAELPPVGIVMPRQLERVSPAVRSFAEFVTRAPR